ncbi:poly polymerase catalytic domain-containing protein [Suillus clintonianus]|uniref:poly polymerase catalytic domain-containing protein n=1 Tax=Suillus clintonianus TaxID=1904413 RepID=UPI001B8771C1|nr:poly polymerase catalytic domain-containing protein [Suillus clintonianus]KAG2129775.1 poly polymerase catalytic domain-containing protein [Suillus clintonianus]
MPPRKKAVPSADVAKPVSSRSTRASTRQANVPPASTTFVTKPISKPKSTKAKRVRDDDEADDTPGPSKKPKVDKDKDTSDNKADDEAKKMVTVVKRGAAPVDPLSGFVNTHQVYSNDDSVWDAMLNQTEVGSNKNKFYVIQLLHTIGNDAQCTLYTRWGRVGEHGQSQIKGPWPSVSAINEFKKQFKSKSGVAWPQRFGMVAAKGKYTWLERAFENEDDKAEGSGSNKKEDEPVPDSKLSSELQALCNLIFSSKLIAAHLSSMNYDANKLPLGKLAKSTILNGFAALKKLAEVVQYPDGDLAKSQGGFRTACETFTSEYYSIIPHVFGRTRPIVISDQELLKRELNLVDALGDMEIAHKLITASIHVDDDGKPLNPLDAHFRSLGLNSMDPVARSSSEFQALVRYTSDTHGQTHHFKSSVLHAFRVEREVETSAWLAKGYDKLPAGDRMLLWHGSRTTNFAGILKQGLRIAPPEAPVTGYMFGKGVYFADMMSKSAGYCYSSLSNQIGVLLLCEVAVKPFLEMNNANYNAHEDCKKNEKLATKGVGMIQPTNWQDAGMALGHKELEGVHMPKGEASNVSPPGAFLMYNEYIVYDPSQIRLRYLLMVKMD